MLSEKFWSQALRAMSAHGPNTLLFPILFAGFLYGLYAGIDPNLALIGLAITYGAFLWGQSSRQLHLERMAKVEVDKVVAMRGNAVDGARRKPIGKAKAGNE